MREFLTSLKVKVEKGNLGKEYHLAKHIDEQIIDLILKMLTVNPAERISAKDALKHEFFTSEPLPCLPNELPLIEGELKELNFKEERNHKIK